MLLQFVHHRGGEEACMAGIALGMVERDAGMLKEGAGITGVAREERGTDAGRDRKTALIELDRCQQASTVTLDSVGHGSWSRLTKQYHELIPTQACNKLIGFSLGPKASGDFRQQPVT